MVRSSLNVLSYGVLVTRFLRKQWHVPSHVFEVAWELAVLSFSHVQFEIISFCIVNYANNICIVNYANNTIIAQ